MMTKWYRKNMVQAPEGDGGAGGGAAGGDGGTGSFITPGGGGTPPAKGGGAGDPSGGSGTGGNPGAGDPGKGGSPTDWRSSLPKELQENASLKKYTSVEALAGAYVNAQKLIGADKIAIPGKHATEDDWKKVFSQLGVPEKVEEYGLKFKDGSAIDEDFSKEFKTNAHKLGILPKQAQALADWFSDVNINSIKKAKDGADKAFKDAVGELQKEWGDGFKLNVARANRVIAEHGGDELAKYLSEKGFGADPQFMKLMAKLGGTLYAEDKVIGEDGTMGGKTPKEVQAEIKKLQQDPAYNDKTHPSHKAAVQEMQDLYKLMYPAVDKK